MIFVKFRIPGVMKIGGNWSIWFFSTSQKSNALIYSYFHDHGYMKLHKKQMLNFFQFSWPRVHKTSLKSNISIFSNFHDPGYTKLHDQHFTKIKYFIFHQFSWPRVHVKESQRVHIKESQMLDFFPIFMTPDTQNFTKNKCLIFSNFQVLH